MESSAKESGNSKSAEDVWPQCAYCGLTLPRKRPAEDVRPDVAGHSFESLRAGLGWIAEHAVCTSQAVEVARRLLATFPADPGTAGLQLEIDEMLSCPMPDGWRAALNRCRTMIETLVGEARDADRADAERKLAQARKDVEAARRYTPPHEPTPAMLNAGRSVYFGDDNPDVIYLRMWWQAMWDAWQGGVDTSTAAREVDPKDVARICADLRAIPIDFGDSTHEDHVCWQAANLLESQAARIAELTEALRELNDTMDAEPRPFAATRAVWFKRLRKAQEAARRALASPRDET